MVIAFLTLLCCAGCEGRMCRRSRSYCSVRSSPGASLRYVALASSPSSRFYAVANSKCPRRVLQTIVLGCFAKLLLYAPWSSAPKAGFCELSDMFRLVDICEQVSQIRRKMLPLLLEYDARHTGSRGQEFHPDKITGVRFNLVQLTEVQCTWVLHCSPIQ